MIENARSGFWKWRARERRSAEWESRGRLGNDCGRIIDANEERPMTQTASLKVLKEGAIATRQLISRARADEYK